MTINFNFDPMSGSLVGSLSMQGYREDDQLTLQSDTDEQLLLHIPFSQAVRLSGILIKSSSTPTQGPKDVKLFVNTPTLGFAGW